MEDDELSPGEFRHILGDLIGDVVRRADGTDVLEPVPNPEGARRLLESIQRRAASGTLASPDLYGPICELLALGLGRFLRGECKSLEHAFGVARPRGNPPNPDVTKRRVLVAAEVVLHKRRHGSTDDVAIAAVADELDLKDDYVKGAYDLHGRRSEGLAHAVASIIETDQRRGEDGASSEVNLHNSPE